MTLEAAVTKIMWILSQTREPDKIRRLFYKTINRTFFGMLPNTLR